MFTPNISEFPKFDLLNLLTTCFGKPTTPTKLCVLIDLPELDLMIDHNFMQDGKFTVQTHGVNEFYKPLKGQIGEMFNLSNVDLFAFKTTYGSNLDPDDDAIDSNGKRLCKRTI